MSTPTAQEMTLDAIRSVPLFASLDDHAAGELRALLRTLEAEAETTLFRAGDEGDAMYLIESGRVRIAVTDEDQRQIVLAELARGDFFGEVSILLGEPPTADVVALTALRCAVLPGGEIRTFLTDHPQVMFRVLQAEARRLAQTLQWLG